MHPSNRQSAQPQKDWQWPKSIFCENRDECITIEQVLEQGWPDYLIANIIRDVCDKCGEIPVE